MSKNDRQMNFVDAMASRENRSNRTARFLGKLGGVLDFAPIEAALREAYTATRGRDPHDPLVMFKMTLLQHFYDLSDPECEAQVADRRSFREFCGLGLADRVPDETALVRFRARLVARGLHTRLRERGILSGIMQPPRRNHPLSAGQAEANGWLAAMRAGIEKIFGHWKRVLGWRRLRYTGLAKGTLELQFKSVAWNLRRLVTLCAA